MSKQELQTAIVSKFVEKVQSQLNDVVEQTVMICRSKLLLTLTQIAISPLLKCDGELVSYKKWESNFVDDRWVDKAQIVHNCI